MARIAIIGSGISGLGSAYLLNAKHDIVVYEKAAQVGGHTRTKTIDYNGKQVAVDTGFIVFNYRNYPHLSALFKHLDVPVQKSNMSFGITANNGALEWGADNPSALFGQRSNLVNIKFYRFLLDIVCFNRNAVKVADAHPDFTLSQLIQHLKLGDWFSQYYILPMGGAIWSCSLETILDFPAKTFVEFFKNHGLLTITQQPQWYTVTGGSQEYVKRLIATFQDKIKTNAEIVGITRQDDKVLIKQASGEVEVFDHVVLACHGDEALGLLSDVSVQEKRVLGAFTCQTNVAVLHKDSSLMPKRKRCWSSWIYHAEKNAPKETISVTYWMNKLQNINDSTPVFVTLNPLKPIPQEAIFDSHIFAHPIYSKASVAAQKLMHTIQGNQNTWFAGAYLRNGFHEDGFHSAVEVAKHFGVEVPWA